MIKILSILLIALFPLMSFGEASNIDARLSSLIQEKIELQAIGQDLSSKDSDELAKLTAQKGIIGTAEIQKRIQDAGTKAPASIALPEKINAAAMVPIIAPTAPTISQEKQIAQQQAYEAAVARAKQDIPNSNQVLPSKQAEQKTSTGKKALISVGTDIGEERDLGAESVLANKPAPAPKIAKKKEIQDAVDPEFQKRLKKDIEENKEIKQTYQEIKNTKVKIDEAPAVYVEAKPKIKKSIGEIYSPISADSKIKNTNFNIERGSQSVIHQELGIDDVLTIKICIAYGVSIVLDDKDELQRVIKDDNIFFDAQEFDNKKGVYVRLTKPIPEGSRWDSAIRLVRKSDDKTYLIKLMGVGCPEGDVTFPKIVYIKEKQDSFSYKQDLLAPEDLIIQVSKGYVRNDEKNTINMYDMLGAANSDLKLLSFEITDAKISKPEESVEFILLDNLQINKWKTKQEFLKPQSEKATELRTAQLTKEGKSTSSANTYRFKVLTPIKKEYIFKQRYMWLLYVNNETKHYQMMKVDLIKYYQNLIDRGFEL